MASNRRKYWLLGGLGTSLTGFGLVATVECGFLKHSGASFWLWGPLGTLSLVAFMAGICLMIDANRFR